MIRIMKTRTLSVALCLLLLLTAAFAAGCSNRAVGTYKGPSVKFMPTGAVGTTEVSYRGTIAVRLDSGEDIQAKAPWDKVKSLKGGSKVEVRKTGSGDYEFVGPVK